MALIGQSSWLAREL
uniref:Uncharacterized protein n=1 Tax=Rhizophora mucronata TaxID=61149 RepID=A0A2P2PV10_RHIMU